MCMLWNHLDCYFAQLRETTIFNVLGNTIYSRASTMMPSLKIFKQGKCRPADDDFPQQNIVSDGKYSITHAAEAHVH